LAVAHVTLRETEEKIEMLSDPLKLTSQTVEVEKTSLRMVTVAPQIDPLWEQLVKARRSDVFHSPAWIRVLTNTYGFDIRANLLLDDADQPVAGMAYMHLSDPLGERIVSLPFCDCTDPLVDTQAQWRQLVAPLLTHGCPVSLRVLHNETALQDERFEHSNRAKWHGHDISALSEEELWLQRLDSHRRNGIKRAERDGVTVSVRTEKEAARMFFDLHLGIRKYKYHLLAQPAAFIENIWEEFVADGNGAFLSADYQGKVIGAMLVLHWKDTLYYKLSASVRDALSVRPNDLLQWHMMKYAKATGHSWIDLGLSDWDQEGLIGFKRKYSTDEKQITFLKYTPPGFELSAAQQQIRKTMGELTALFTDPDVPDSVTERAGALLYRHFS
jgi:CelD/BcsL family acetyltransferase involved in cellulose biosynthesis